MSTDNIPVAFDHQRKTTDFMLRSPLTFIASDPGTGKTRSVIDAFNERADKKRLLVFAPLSILRPSWGDDIDKFCPELTWAVAHGKNRRSAFEGAAQIVIMNHDGVKWLTKEKDWKQLLAGFDELVIDESTAFKNRGSQRSKAMYAVANQFEIKRLMTGTPNPNTVCDLWHQFRLLDQGARLGQAFYRFRGQVCDPKQNGPDPMHVEWVDKDGAEEMVADMISDITVRFKFEDCLDIPENDRHFLYVDLPPQIRSQYEQLAQRDWLATNDGEINVVHASARVRKLLQLLSGAVYDDQGNPVKVHDGRYKLVMDLVEQRKHSVVAFNWRHEKTALIDMAEKRGLKYGVIDGTVKNEDRETVVQQFQAGFLDVIFCHPQSAGHGLTLTRGTSTIWCSPTYNAEHFQQFNRRIYRAGQTQKTETICIAARDTKEEAVYEKLDGKLVKMDDILGIFADITEMEAA